MYKFDSDAIQNSGASAMTETVAKASAVAGSTISEAVAGNRSTKTESAAEAESEAAAEVEAEFEVVYKPKVKTTESAIEFESTTEPEAFADKPKPKSESITELEVFLDKPVAKTESAAKLGVFSKFTAITGVRLVHFNKFALVAGALFAGVDSET